MEEDNNEMNSIRDDKNHNSDSDSLQDQDRQILAYLLSSWNRLDVSEWAPIFQGTVLRKLYLHDLSSVRQGRRIYYSLGAGPQRQAFGEAFSSLSSRRLQEIFLQHATLCLQENRFMSQADWIGILEGGRGKRLHVDANHDLASSTDAVNTCSTQLHRNKRQRTSLDAIQCFA